jgi:hypothetical protein
MHLTATQVPTGTVHLLMSILLNNLLNNLFHLLMSILFNSIVTHHPPSPSNSRDQSTMIRDRHQPPMPPHRTKISILGDSMIKRVQSRQIRRAVSTSKSVYIRSFPGAKSLDMTDFARPTMRDNADHIIIHIGTNDVRQSNPEDVIRNVENLCNQIKDQCPHTTISLSELIVRNDFPDATTKISYWLLSTGR